MDMKSSAKKVTPLTYWSASPGNLLSSIVWSLGADLRKRSDAIAILQTVSNTSREQIADMIGEGEDGCYRRLQPDAFADIRSKAIETVVRCIDESGARRPLMLAT
jgi:hypothetical protein